MKKCLVFHYVSLSKLKERNLKLYLGKRKSTLILGQLGFLQCDIFKHIILMFEAKFFDDFDPLK